MTTDHHSSLRPSSLVIHGGQHPESSTGAVMPPIFTASTYAQVSPGKHKGFEYSRSHNPTRYALERLAARLEGSTIAESDDPSCGGFAFASGMAAMSTCLELIDAGGEIVAMNDLYGGSYRLLTRVRERSQGLKVKYLDLTNAEHLKSRDGLNEDTAMVWVETPTNPNLKLVDLEAVAKITREVAPKALLVCDNTFASPMNQRPLDYGFDIVHHSATKYFGGHSDAVGGLLVTGDLAMAKRLRFLQNSVGAIMGPFDAYMFLRGAKTLSIRMQRHNENAMAVAEFLEKHPRVDRVLYPGLASHPQYELAKKQMKFWPKGSTNTEVGGYGGMITFFIKGGLDNARKFLEHVRVFTLAESLGGVESLIEHPAIMTHASVPPEARKELGISDTLVRVSVGIEDARDLIADLDAALNASA